MSGVKPKTDHAIRALDSISQARLAIAQVKKEADLVLEIAGLGLKERAIELFWSSHDTVVQHEFGIGEARRFAENRDWRGDAQQISQGLEECWAGLREAKSKLCAAFAKIHDPQPKGATDARKNPEGSRRRAARGDRRSP